MNAAGLSSPRLQRVLRVLAPGKPVTTRTIVRRAQVCAVNAIVAELRHHGAEIACFQEIVGGRRRWFYRMDRAPEGWAPESRAPEGVSHG